MGVCEVCGNNYDKSMQIFVRERRHVFDCFECAIRAWPPAARNARARSSDTASSTTTPSIAAHTAPPPSAYRRPSTGSSERTHAGADSRRRPGWPELLVPRLRTTTGDRFRIRCHARRSSL